MGLKLFTLKGRLPKEGYLIYPEHYIGYESYTIVSLFKMEILVAGVQKSFISIHMNEHTLRWM